MHYRFSGLVACENDARQICRLLENLNPKPLGCGFTEIDLTKKIWEVDAYFDYVIGSGILYLLEKLYSVEFHFNEIRYNDWIAKVERKLTPINLQKVFIHGTHHKKEVSLNKINIEINLFNSLYKYKNIILQIIMEEGMSSNIAELNKMQEMQELSSNIQREIDDGKASNYINQEGLDNLQQMQLKQLQELQRMQELQLNNKNNEDSEEESESERPIKKILNVLLI